MADRRKIRSAFFSELSSLAGDYTVTYGDGTTDTVTLDADNIVLQSPEEPEDLPQLVYRDTYNRRYHNNVGLGPDRVDRDSNDNVTAEVWKEYIEAQITVRVRAANDLEKEPIYEAVRRRFARNQFGAWSVKNALHEDVRKMDVLNAEPADVGGVEDRIRGDALEIHIEFFREYSFDSGSNADATNITTITHEIDADLDDSTAGLNYTTT